MSDFLYNLDLHFSNLTSFITMLFDTKTVGVCTIHTNKPTIRDGDRFLIFEAEGVAS